MKNTVRYLSLTSLTFHSNVLSPGPISSLTILGQNYVILNGKLPLVHEAFYLRAKRSPRLDFRMAVDLLHKRGNTYADRPTIQMAKLTGWDRALSTAKYGPRFREYRKLIGKVIGTRGGVVCITNLYPCVYERAEPSSTYRLNSAAQKNNSLRCSSRHVRQSSDCLIFIHTQWLAACT